ncbi:MAG: hypothetical protein OEQ13_05150 [Acidobacteriota bacterium]|nr:hypothetical protein [Acidobacteriota bacterium]
MSAPATQIPRRMARHGGRAAESGISFVEVMVSLALLSVIGLIFYQLFIGSMRVTMMLESESDLVTLGQRVVNEMRLEIMQSRTAFEDDTVGQSYLAQVSLPTDAPVLTGSLLPIVDTGGRLEPDSGTRRVGNSMLLARHLEPTLVPFDHDGDSNTPEIDFEADLYRFRYVYLSENTERSFLKNGHYLDLVLATSGRYADFFQLDGLTAAQKADVAVDLYAGGITTAWDPGRPADQAFYQIQSDGSLTGPFSHTIDLTEYRSLLPEFRGGRISGSMNYSVGIQSDPPLETDDRIGLYAEPSGPFPGGFEVLAVGPASSRQVLVRVVLLAEYNRRLSSHENRVIVTTSSF